MRSLETSITIEDGKLPLAAFSEAPLSEDDYLADLEFVHPRALRVRAHTNLTPIEVASATPIAKCNAHTVASVTVFENGKVFFVGTSLGGSIASGDVGGVELLRSIALEVVAPSVSCAGRLLPRLIEGVQRSALTVFNDEMTRESETVKVPVRFTRARNIYTGAEVAIVKGSLTATVSFKDVSVYDLS